MLDRINKALDAILAQDIGHVADRDRLDTIVNEGKALIRDESGITLDDVKVLTNSDGVVLYL